MTTPTSLLECLKRLQRNYLWSKNDIKKIKSIEDYTITSIAYTADGGFDRTNGDFHKEERDVSYKIRIKYKIAGSGKEKVLILMAVQDDIEKTMAS